MNLMDIAIDKKTQQHALEFLDSLIKELEGINMALRDLADKKERELSILKNQGTLE